MQCFWREAGAESFMSFAKADVLSVLFSQLIFNCFIDIFHILILIDFHRCFRMRVNLVGFRIAT
jgi:hypothetical protein